MQLDAIKDRIDLSLYYVKIVKKIQSGKVERNEFVHRQTVVICLFRIVLHFWAVALDSRVNK